MHECTLLSRCELGTHISSCIMSKTNTQVWICEDMVQASQPISQCILYIMNYIWPIPRYYAHRIVSFIYMSALIIEHPSMLTMSWSTEYVQYAYGWCFGLVLFSWQKGGDRPWKIKKVEELVPQICIPLLRSAKR